jgi:serine O-acetyltransferase
MAFVDDVWRDVDRRVRMGARALDLLLDPGSLVVASYRVARAANELPRPLAKAVSLVQRPVHALLQLLTQTELPPQANIGGGLHVGHVGGIVVSPEARIGRDCNLSQGVTIGIAGRGDRRGVPCIGDRVYIGPGAKVFGKIRIGNDVAIGANAVVREDVPDGAVVAGIPAKVVSMRGSKDFVVPGTRRPPLGRLLRALLPQAGRKLLAA